MKFRARIVVAVTGVTMVTLGSAFSVVLYADNRLQQRQFDDAVEAEARDEAIHVANHIGHNIALGEGPGPTASDVGPLIKYEAVYGPGGSVVASTETFLGSPPRWSSLHVGNRVCFNLRFLHEHLRGAVVPVPGHGGFRLLLAAPRDDLDADATFLRKAMGSVFCVAVVWASLVATWIVRRLTRGHDAIVAVAHRVVAGDLSARIGRRVGDAETTQLAHDLDAMIDRLESLISGQQRFVAHAAHELRTPLATLYGELSHALRRPRDEPAYRAAIEEALDATRRLKALADDLLTLARLGSREARVDTSNDTETALTDAIVAGALKSVEALAHARDVKVRVRGDGLRVRGRLPDLERALRNLLDNALWHAPKGSEVEVVTSERDAMAEVSVSDEGAGVPAAERERIFEPFYRGTLEQVRDVPGAGLGLAIVREIARSHGGDVLLVTDPSASDKGARFVLRLPLAANPAAD